MLEKGIFQSNLERSQVNIVKNWIWHVDNNFEILWLLRYLTRPCIWAWSRWCLTTRQLLLTTQLILHVSKTWNLPIDYNTHEAGQWTIKTVAQTVQVMWEYDNLNLWRYYVICSFFVHPCIHVYSISDTYAFLCLQTILLLKKLLMPFWKFLRWDSFLLFDDYKNNTNNFSVV